MKYRHLPVVLTISLISLTAVATAREDPAATTTAIAEWLRESSGYLDLGRADLAIRVLGEAVEIAPDNADLHLSLGMACAVDGDLGLAIGSLKRAIDLDSTMVAAHCALGYCLSESGEDEQGGAALRRGVALDPAGTITGFTDALCETSKLKRVRGKLREENREMRRLLSRIEFFRETMELEGGDLPRPEIDDHAGVKLHRETAYLRRIALMRLWKIERALINYRKVLDRDPGRQRPAFTISFRRGKVLMEMGALDLALEEMEQASDTKIGGLADEGKLTIEVHIGMILHELGQLKRSLEVFDQVVRFDHDHVFAFYYRGHVQRDLKRYTSAAGSYKRALDLNPDLDDAWHMLGKCHLALEQPDQALTAFHWAVLINAADPRHFNMLGVVLLERGSRREAEENFREAIAINPRYPQAWYNLGRALELTGRRTKALDAYNEAVRLDEDYAQAWNNVGAILSEIGQLEESVDAFRRALAADPQLSDAGYNLGSTLRALRRFTEAAEVLEVAAAADSTSADVWRELGIVREKQSLFQEALIALQRSTDLDGNNFQAWFTLARIHEMLGDDRATRRATARMRALDPDLAEALLTK